jgi:hypothetical protein
MQRETTLKDALYKPFDNVDSRPGRGGTYDYIKWQHVADRMNQVFGTYWSSQIVSEHILNNDSDIILRVKIEVSDPETKETFSQEGYGGASVRNGEEAGTAFKSAYSKGIKDACKKWGIGLYLSEDHVESAPVRNYNSGPSTQTPPVQSIHVAPVASAPSVGYQPEPVQQVAPVQQPEPIQSMPSTQPAPVEMPAPVNSVMGMPPAPVSPVIASGVAPVTPVASVPEAQPAPTEQPAPTVQDNSDTPGTVTAVQSLAISNMAKMHGAQTEEEVLTMIINTDAAGLGRQIASLKDLSYNEAVKIIRTVKELQDKR